MLLYVFALSLGLAVVALVVLASYLVTAQSGATRRRVAEVRSLGGERGERPERRRRFLRRERVMELIEAVGDRLNPHRNDSRRQLLVQAGYDGENAPAVYWGLRTLLTAVLATGGFFFAGFVDLGTTGAALGALYGAGVGWLGPLLLVRARRRTRQKEIQRALPDALDLLVVCVESGLALNQAMVRVAEEVRKLSPALARELTLTNLRIQAGTPRAEALRRLGDRTGVDDLRSLVSALIQTDRFGTSIARSLRTHAESLRTKRRQRAEEAAAKTTIKMVFPLVLCIFPALFVVILGPGIIRVLQAVAGLQ